MLDSTLALPAAAIPHGSVMLVTPDLARDWLANRQYIGQRKKQPSHVTALAKKMRRNLFVQGGATIYCVTQLDDGCIYLINGQHTLSAIVESGLAQYLTVTYLTTRNKKETGYAYSVLDTHKRRNLHDSYRALELDKELEIPLSYVDKLGAAVKLIDGNFADGHFDIMDDELFNLMKDYAEAMQDYLKLIENVTTNLKSAVLRRSTLAVALVTLHFSTVLLGDAKVLEFWKEVIWDDGLKLGDPRKVAHAHLMTTHVKDGGNSISQKDKTSVAYSTRFLAQCFNKYAAGETMQVKPRVISTDPIKLIGSPFTGKA